MTPKGLYILHAWESLAMDRTVFYEIYERVRRHLKNPVEVVNEWPLNGPNLGLWQSSDGKWHIRDGEYFGNVLLLTRDLIAINAGLHGREGRLLARALARIVIHIDVEFKIEEFLSRALSPEHCTALQKYGVRCPATMQSLAEDLENIYYENIESLKEIVRSV